ncbi:MAG: hypothetical protein QOJ54_2845, partial [Aliidongia sp.]|nr:hypothetical protein [Aliidongia sp.]
LRRLRRPTVIQLGHTGLGERVTHADCPAGRAGDGSKHWFLSLIDALLG